MRALDCPLACDEARKQRKMVLLRWGAAWVSFLYGADGAPPTKRHNADMSCPVPAFTSDYSDYDDVVATPVIHPRLRIAVDFGFALHSAAVLSQWSGTTCWVDWIGVVPLLLTRLLA